MPLGHFDDDFNDDPGSCATIKEYAGEYWLYINVALTFVSAIIFAAYEFRILSTLSDNKWSFRGLTPNTRSYILHAVYGCLGALFMAAESCNFHGKRWPTKDFSYWVDIFHLLSLAWALLLGVTYWRSKNRALHLLWEQDVQQKRENLAYQFSTTLSRGGLILCPIIVGITRWDVPNAARAERLILSAGFIGCAIGAFRTTCMLRQYQMKQRAKMADVDSASTTMGRLGIVATLMTLIGLNEIRLELRPESADLQGHNNIEGDWSHDATILFFLAYAYTVMRPISEVPILHSIHERMVYIFLELPVEASSYILEAVDYYVYDCLVSRCGVNVGDDGGDGESDVPASPTNDRGTDGSGEVADSPKARDSGSKHVENVDSPEGGRSPKAGGAGNPEGTLMKNTTGAARSSSNGDLPSGVIAPSTAQHHRSRFGTVLEVHNNKGRASKKHTRFGTLSKRLLTRHQNQLALATKTLGVAKGSTALSTEGTDLRKRAKFAKTQEERADLYRESIAKYNLSVALSPTDSKAFYGRGVAERKLGLLTQDTALLNSSIVSFDRALELDPEGIGGTAGAVWNNRGNALVALGRHVEAVACFDRAFQIDSTNMKFVKDLDKLKSNNEVKEAHLDVGRRVRLKLRGQLLCVGHTALLSGTCLGLILCDQKIASSLTVSGGLLTGVFTGAFMLDKIWKIEDREYEDIVAVATEIRMREAEKRVAEPDPNDDVTDHTSWKKMYLWMMVSKIMGRMSVIGDAICFSAAAWLSCSPPPGSSPDVFTAPVNIEVLRTLNYSLRYQLVFNFVLCFYMILVGAFLAIHAFPNVFPPGGFIKNWSYVWFEFSFDIFVMTAYGVITRGLGCDKKQGKLVANPIYRCDGTFFRRYLAATSLVMALILLSVLSFSSFFFNEKRRNPRYLPRSKFLVSLFKFFVAIINALPMPDREPSFIKWSIVFICLALVLIQQIKLQPVVGNGRWINNSRTGIYAVALSGSILAFLHMVTKGTVVVHVSGRDHDVFFLLYVLGAPFVFGLAVYFNDRLAEPLSRKDLIDAVSERRLRDGHGNFTEAMVVAFHSCPDVQRVVNDCMGLAMAESQDEMEEAASSRSTFSITGQRERMDSASAHDPESMFIGGSSAKSHVGESKGECGVADGQQSRLFNPTKMKVAPMVEGLGDTAAPGSRRNSARAPLEPLPPALKIISVSQHHEPSGEVGSGDSGCGEHAHTAIPVGKSTSEALAETHESASTADGDSARSAASGAPPLVHQITSRGTAFHMNVQMAKAQAVGPDVSAAFEMLATLAEIRHGRETMREKAPHTVEFLLKLVHRYPQYIVPILYNFCESGEACRELCQKNGGFLRLLRCIRESSEFWSPLSAARLNQKVATLAKSNTEKHLLGGAATNNASSLPQSHHFPRKVELRKSIMPSKKQQKALAASLNRFDPEQVKKEAVAGELDKEVMAESRTSLLMGKENAELIRRLHSLAVDMTAPANYLVHWIDYLPFDGPHEVEDQDMKLWYLFGSVAPGKAIKVFVVSFPHFPDNEKELVKTLQALSSLHERYQGMKDGLLILQFESAPPIVDDEEEAAGSDGAEAESGGDDARRSEGSGGEGGGGAGYSVESDKVVRGVSWSHLVDDSSAGAGDTSAAVRASANGVERDAEMGGDEEEGGGTVQGRVGKREATSAMSVKGIASNPTSTPEKEMPTSPATVSLDGEVSPSLKTTKLEPLKPLAPLKQLSFGGVAGGGDAAEGDQKGALKTRSRSKSFMDRKTTINDVSWMVLKMAAREMMMTGEVRLLRPLRDDVREEKYQRGKARVVETIFHHFRKRMGLAELETEEVSIRRSTSHNKEQERKFNVNKTFQLLQKSASLGTTSSSSTLPTVISSKRKQSRKGSNHGKLFKGATAKNLLGGNSTEAKLAAHGHFETSPLKSSATSSFQKIQGKGLALVAPFAQPAPKRGPPERGMSTGADERRVTTTNVRR